jgi:UDP-glucose:glycoprotein glucosyltransferase
MFYLISTNLLSKASPAQILHAFDSDYPVTSGDDHVDVQRVLQELTNGVVPSDFNQSAYAQYVKSSRLVARELQLQPGEQALIVNGRVGRIRLSLVSKIHPSLVGRTSQRWRLCVCRLSHAGSLRVTQQSRTRSAGTGSRNLRTQQVIKHLFNTHGPLTDLFRDSFAHLVSMACSVIWSIQLPDPSEAGLFDAPPKPRQRNYQFLANNYTFVAHSVVAIFTILTLSQNVRIG